MQLSNIIEQTKDQNSTIGKIVLSSHHLHDNFDLQRTMATPNESKLLCTLVFRIVQTETDNKLKQLKPWSTVAYL